MYGIFFVLLPFPSGFGCNLSFLPSFLPITAAIVSLRTTGLKIKVLGPAGTRSVRARCVVPLALPLPLTFPQVFDPRLSRYGDVDPSHSAAPPECDSGSAAATVPGCRKADVESVPCLTRLQATAAFADVAAAQLQSFRSGFLSPRLSLFPLDCALLSSSNLSWAQSLWLTGGAFPLPTSSLVPQFVLPSGQLLTSCHLYSSAFPPSRCRVSKICA